MAARLGQVRVVWDGSADQSEGPGAGLGMRGLASDSGCDRIGSVGWVFVGVGEYPGTAARPQTTPSPTTTDAGTPASPTPTGRTKPHDLPAICPALRPSRDPDPSPPTWLCTAPKPGGQFRGHQWANGGHQWAGFMAATGRNPWPLTHASSNRPASHAIRAARDGTFVPSGAIRP